MITLFRSWNLVGICPVFNWWHWSGRRNREGSLDIWESVNCGWTARDKRHSFMGSVPRVWECHTGNGPGKASLLGACKKQVMVSFLKSSCAAPSSISSEERGCNVTRLFLFSCRNWPLGLAKTLCVFGWSSNGFVFKWDHKISEGKFCSASLGWTDKNSSKLSSSIMKQCPCQWIFLHVVNHVCFSGLFSTSAFSRFVISPFYVTFGW